MEDIKVFEGKNLADIFKEIHTNTVSKRNQIETIISGMQTFITTANDAVILIPMIKELLDVSVKNEEQLIKMAQVVQRLAISNGSTSDTLLTSEERDQLIAQARDASILDIETSRELKTLANKTNNRVLLLEGSDA